MRSSTPSPAPSNSASLIETLGRWLLVVLFLMTVSMPLVWLDRGMGAPAAQENRTLHPFPREFGLSWFKRVEAWFSDHYGLRDAVIHYASLLNIASTGKPANQEVVIGKEGWLFLDANYVPGMPHFAASQGKTPLSQAQLDTITRQLIQLQQHLQACGIGFYVVLAPDKNTVYPDKLGMAMPRQVRSPADQWVAAMQAAGAQNWVIDLRPVLQQARAHHDTDLYYKTDTHWNTLGGFVAYQHILDRLQRGPHSPAAAAHQQRQHYQVTQEKFPGGDIAVNLLDLPGYYEDHVVRLSPSTARAATPTTAAPWAVARDASAQRFHNPRAQGQLLLYRDSFGTELLPFLAEDFQELHALPGHVVNGEDVAHARPTLVIVEKVERNLTGLLDAPVNLAQACPRSSHAQTSVRGR